MACDTCGCSILFGGIKEGDKRYCSKKCYKNDEIGRFSESIPAGDVRQVAVLINSGICPVCEGRGPVDIYQSYSVFSIIFYTSWKTNETVCCKQCATKKQLGDLLKSMVLGWWGIPFGLIVTPVQIVRNVFAVFTSKETDGPTQKLMERSRLILASEYIKKN